MRFADIENTFDRVPRKVMAYTMRKKGLPEVIMSAVMSLYHRVKTNVRLGSGLPEEFWVQVGVYQHRVGNGPCFSGRVRVRDWFGLKF